MSKKLLLVTSFLVLSGCSNPYTQFYTDYTGGRNVLEDPQFIVSTDEPKLFHGTTIEQDTQRMLEDGYALLGESGFNAAEKDEGAALEQATRVHAAVVIVYRQYMNTRSGSIPITTPDTQTTNHSGSVYGSGGHASYSRHSTTYGSTTTYVPYSVNRYDYLATYWIKVRHRFGIRFRDLTTEERQDIGTNKGAYIAVVVKNSPAFEADLLVGDIVRKLDGVEVIDGDHLSKLLAKTKHATARFEVFRQSKTIQGDRKQGSQ